MQISTDRSNLSLSKLEGGMQLEVLAKRRKKSLFLKNYLYLNNPAETFLVNGKKIQHILLPTLRRRE